MRLWVCCGHGAGDPGACGNGFSEAERVRALGAEIKRRGGDSVVLMDTSRNWYADRGFDSVSIPDGDAVVELHMDAASAGARGGHVVYRAGFAPDAYDTRLADGIASMFPGRSERLSARSDLRNCNVCAQRGINYRLVENGFVTSASDVATFNARIGDLADLYLRAFGISPASGGTSAGQSRAEVPEVERGVHRLMRAGTCDHLWTTSRDEAQRCVDSGLWEYEGIAWAEPEGGDATVWRLYRRDADTHFYTVSVEEVGRCVIDGWEYEGPAFGALADGSPVWRFYDPGTGRHMFTTSDAERAKLEESGWDYEGVGWYV